MEKDKQQEATAEKITLSPSTIDIFIEDAFINLTLANNVYEQAKSEEKPKEFTGSKYEEAQKFYIQAESLFKKAHEYGHKTAHVLMRNIHESKIVPIEHIKATLSHNYSVSEQWAKSCENQRSISHKEENKKIPGYWLEALDNKDFHSQQKLTWHQALKELENKKIPADKTDKKTKEPKKKEKKSHKKDKEK